VISKTIYIPLIHMYTTIIFIGNHEYPLNYLETMKGPRKELSEIVDLICIGSDMHGCTNTQLMTNMICL
jgi:hypothetical protein